MLLMHDYSTNVCYNVLLASKWPLQTSASNQPTADVSINFVLDSLLNKMLQGP